MRSMLVLALLASGCGASSKPAPQPGPQPVCAPSAAAPAGTVAGTIASSPAPASSSCPEIETVAARVATEWGTPEAPRVVLAGQVADVAKRYKSYDKQRRGFVDELRPHTTKGLACAAAAHVRIGLVDDVFRAMVLRAKLEVLTPEAESKIAEIEANANKILSDPSSTPKQKDNARAMLEKAKEVRESTAATGQTALKGWSAYAEMELIDAYARGMIEARKAGLKAPIFASAWKRMGAIVKEVGVEAVNERLEQVQKDHADVPVDASAFLSPCTWPAGC